MVKFAVSLLVASAVASSALAQGTYASTEAILAARDAALSTQNSLFSRAAIQVLNDLYSREELSELFGREVDELSLRDLEELLERAQDAGSPATPAAAAGAPQATPTTAAPVATTSTASPAAATTPANANQPLNIFALAIKRLAAFFSGAPAPTTTKSAPGTPTPVSSVAAPAATPAATPAADAPAAPAAVPADPSAQHQARSEWLYEEPVERSLDYADQFEELVLREFYEDLDARAGDDFEASFERRALGSEWDQRVFRRALDIMLEELD